MNGNEVSRKSKERLYFFEKTEPLNPPGKNVFKAILKIEIRVQFAKIRGYLLIKSVANASTYAVT
jgi:hypothetical protein